MRVRFGFAAEVSRARLHLVHGLSLAAIATLIGFVVLAALGSRASGARAGVLRVALAAEPRTLDPHATTSLDDFRVLGNVYEGLVRFADDRLTIVPALAESWSISDEGRTYEFRLRRGVRFHDGSPFDAAAVRFNLERLIDPSHPYRDTGPFPLASFFEVVERIEEVGPERVRFVLERPFAPLLSNLAYPIGFMVSPRAVRTHAERYGRHPSGTGPFRLRAWHADRALVLERNADYWGVSASLEQVVFRPLADPMTRLAELRSGGLDVLPEAPADVLPSLAESGDYRVLSRTGPHVWFLILNTRQPPFDDVRARRAVNYAVDRVRLVERVLGETASVATGVIPDAFAWARDPALRPYAFDAERAKRLLSDSGAPREKLRLIIPSAGPGMLEPELMASAIQSDLAKVGLNVEIQSYEWSAYLQEVNAGLDADVHMAAMAWMTNDPDTLPYLALRSGAQPPNGFNSGWYQNRELDSLIENARAAVDRGERARLYHAIDRLAFDDAPWLFVASWRQVAVVRTRVDGLVASPSFALRLGSVRTN